MRSWVLVLAACAAAACTSMPLEPKDRIVPSPDMTKFYVGDHYEAYLRTHFMFEEAFDSGASALVYQGVVRRGSLNEVAFLVVHDSLRRTSYARLRVPDREPVFIQLTSMFDHFQDKTLNELVTRIRVREFAIEGSRCPAVDASLKELESVSLNPRFGFTTNSDDERVVSHPQFVDLRLHSFIQPDIRYFGESSDTSPLMPWVEKTATALGACVGLSENAVWGILDAR